MTRTTIRQADMQRLIRAAGLEGASVQVDLRSYVVSICPKVQAPSATQTLNQPATIFNKMAPDGKENWDAKR